MRFKYITKNKKGKKEEGVVDASNLNKARKVLLEKDLVLLSIKPIDKRKVKEIELSIPFFSRISNLDKLLFAKHLSLMIKAGLSLREGVESIKEQTGSKKFRSVLNKVIHHLDNGESLANSLERYPNIFSELFVNLIRVGETSGTLEENLNHLALQLERSYDLKMKVKAAMVYPIFVLASTIGLAIGLALFILPKLVPLFKSFDVELPLPTKILLFVIESIQNYSLYFILIVVGLVAFFILFSRLRKVKATSHKFVFKLPLIGPLVKNVSLALLARTLGTLIKSGIPIIEALNITANTLSNSIYYNHLKEVSFRVQRGEKMTAYLRTQPKIFPPTFSQMIEVGEKTGNLEESLVYLAEFYEKEVDNTTKNLSAVIEPVLLIVIAVGVAFVAVSIIMPIYELTRGLKG